MKFKKSLAAVLSLTALFSMSTALVGCKKDKQPENPSVTNNDEAIVQSALDNLTVKSTITDNFSLSIQGAGGVTISWSSSTPEIISIVGGSATVVRPLDKDTTVDLTATATLNSVEKTKKFTVTVTMLENNSTPISEVLATADETSVEIRGVVTSVIYQTSKSDSNLVFGVKGYWVSDSTGTIYVYGNSEVAKGNLVSIKGTKGTNKELPEIKEPEVTVLKKSETAPAFKDATEITIPELMALTDGCYGKVYKIIATPTVYKTSTYVNFRLYDAAGEYINEYADTYKANLDINAERYEQYADYYDNDGEAKVCYFAIQGKSNQGAGDWRGNLLAIENLPADQQAQADATKALAALDNKYYEATEVDLKAKSTVEITVAENNYVSYADGKIKITALPDEAVEVTITATATIDGITKTDTKTITVQKLNIMTIEQALAAAKDDKVLIKGTIGAVSSKGYVITDGVKGIYVYSTLPAEYKVGDVVLVSGTKDLYYKGAQIKDVQLTKLNEAASANPACVPVDAAKITSYLTAETQYEIFMGTVTGKYTFDGDHREIVVDGHEYTISLDGLTAQQIAGYDAAKDQTVVVEGWVITANTLYSYVSVVVTKITLNGTELLPKEPTPTPTPELPEGAVQISFADTANRTEFTTEKQVWVQNGITVTNNKASSKSDVANYANPARFYKSSDLEITAEKNIKTLVFHYVDTSKSAYHPETLTIDGCTFTLDTTTQTFTITLTTPASSLTISGLGIQWRISSIDVIYAE